MPIRPEFRQFYGAEWRKEVRPRILKRAGNRCEQCGVQNTSTVMRVRGFWLEQAETPSGFVYSGWRDAAGEIVTLGADYVGAPLLPHLLDPEAHWVRIVLTIAHLNHVSGDDRDENLKALCQWCHLNYDKLHHAESRAARKDAARPLLRVPAP